ncbi:MAG: helix-turn-helix transcriptional regulator [Lachnospiraceae bacterium]|nr:helix-turn-helix transcriptional regulator [Lachnospiraceae bacterium]
MEYFELAKALIGESVTEEDLKYVDCYIHKKMGLFIPSLGPCGYAQKLFHTHPSYMFVITFSKEEFQEARSIKERENQIVVRENQYPGMAVSPDIPHNDIPSLHYYCILIEKDYFEEQYKLYSNEKPDFQCKQFAICHDILHALNMFVFEYSKKMPNAEITLDAQATILVHWLIRSVLGETYDMRSVSNDYATARAQQYIEVHYAEKITVNYLAELGNLSVSSFNRVFKKETKMTPMDYLMEIRLQQAKKLLRRKEVSVTEVAIRCGFSSSAHFSASFRKWYGLTPTEYRSKYQ